MVAPSNHRHFDHLDAWLAVARAQWLHADHLRARPELLANPEQLIGTAIETLQNLGLPPAAARWLSAPDRSVLDLDRRWLERESIELLHFGGPGFPVLLTEIASAPLLLFVRGAAVQLQSAQIAIVGSRRPTAVGMLNARHFAASLASAGLTITSGLAIGIDRAAHEGAMRTGNTGRTVAVLGTGLDLIYPRAHRALADQIVAAGGALVSEFPRGTTPHKLNFPRRNRLISGLSLGTLVVEAARRSGSLNTARLAGEQGRETFAIPGSIHNPLAQGCHSLIRQGAKLVEEPAEILIELRLPLENQVLTEQPRGPAGNSALDKPHEILLDALGFEPASVDLLVERTGFSCQSLSAMLLNLELEGRVAAQPGGRYVQLSQGH
jgi:DNA processing protein